MPNLVKCRHCHSRLDRETPLFFCQNAFLFEGKALVFRSRPYYFSLFGNGTLHGALVAPEFDFENRKHLNS